MALVTLPTVSFAQKNFARKVLRDANSNDYDWTSVSLQIPDAYAGPTRGVRVDMFVGSQCILLKSVDFLPKWEFEELFEFHCGGFKRDRIIEIDKTVLRLDV